MTLPIFADRDPATAALSAPLVLPLWPEGVPPAQRADAPAARGELGPERNDGGRITRECRALFPGRAEMIAYCAKHNIPVEASLKKPYSMDRNLLHISYEAGILEDP